MVVDQGANLDAVPGDVSSIACAHSSVAASGGSLPIMLVKLVAPWLTISTSQTALQVRRAEYVAIVGLTVIALGAGTSPGPAHR